MLATWIQFWDHWSTTLLTGTVSPGQASRCLSNSRWTIQVGIAEGSSEFSRARKACLLLSWLSRHSSPSFFLKYLPFFSGSISRNFFQNLRSKSFLELTSQYTVAATIPGWDQFLSEIWIWSESIKRNSHVLCRGDSGLWSEESDVIRKKVNCSPAY